jgi:hypothetical protein
LSVVRGQDGNAVRGVAAQAEVTVEAHDELRLAQVLTTNTSYTNTINNHCSKAHIHSVEPKIGKNNKVVC